MLIANNCTRENGQFMGDQICYIKIAYLMVQNSDADKILMSMSPANEMHFLWQKFIDTYNVEVIYDNFNPGDNHQRWEAWDKWRVSREINGISFDYYRELYLRIHGVLRQSILSGTEIGTNRKNIYEYVYYGQEHLPETCLGSDWFDDTLIYHPEHTRERDVYIAPFCKTQGNLIFTFYYWETVVRYLISVGVSVTVGHEGPFCEDLVGHPLYKKYWGDHKQWLEEVCRHKLVACGNTGTGWVAAACGIPLITMEPHNSCMADHRYRQCGLKNIVEVIDGFTLDSLNNDVLRAAEYCANRIIEEVKQVVVMTTGCYDILHAGHIRHLERSRALGSKLIVALNSDSSVQQLKGYNRPINPQEDRKAVLTALRCVDEVVIFDELTAQRLIAELKPDILTVGYGYKAEDIIGRELVSKAVVTCTESTGLSTTKIVKKIRIGEIVEICKKAMEYSINPFSKLNLLADQFLSCIELQGDVVDLGSYKGGSAFVLRCLSKKPLHLFDTWEGTPYSDDLCHHKKGEWVVPLATCKLNIGEAYYHKGIFPATAELLKDRQFCFVFVDSDTYQSVKDAIEFFWPRMVYSGKMVFDDYGWEPCAGVKKAIDEVIFSGQKQVIANQYTAIFTKR